MAIKYPADQPVTTLDATDLRSLFRAAYDWLAHNYEQVNRLNVFPVPDGDTGTNMLLTIRSALNNIVHRGGQTVGDVADAAAEGAHQGFSAAIASSWDRLPRLQPCVERERRDHGRRSGNRAASGK